LFSTWKAIYRRAVGRNLRGYRQARGLSQEAFADVFGFHRTHMGEIERGEENMTLRKVERLAARLGLDPIALLEWEE
jgi:transcriptional regulator with XRE-family HTH domain